jgi:hypothetical protein
VPQQCRRTKKLVRKITVAAGSSWSVLIWNPGLEEIHFRFGVRCASLAEMRRKAASAARTRDDLAKGMLPFSSIADIPRFPFESFEQLQAAVAIRSFNVGVDALAAAEWADGFSTKLSRFVVTTLSLLLVAAAAAAVVAAFVTGEYWLLAAAPIQAVAFYISHPASPIRKWVTVGGAISVAVFLDLLLNGLPIAATLVAYAGLTFAAVRAAGYVANSAFRKALLSEEDLFLAAYAGGVCTVRNNQSKRVYSV